MDPRGVKTNKKKIEKDSVAERAMNHIRKIAMEGVEVEVDVEDLQRRKTAGLLKLDGDGNVLGKGGDRIVKNADGKLVEMSKKKKGFDLKEAFAHYDTDGSGSIDMNELMEVIKNICGDEKYEELTDEEKEGIVTLFDPNGDGELDREEFSSLMKATIMSKMTHVEFLMKNDAAGKVFNDHMKKEFTEENSSFYTAIEAWKKIESPTIEETQKILALHIQPGSDLEVNIPATQVDDILESFAKAEGNKLLVPKTIFDAAQSEIYKLMDRDSYARFKKNPEHIKAMTDALFDQADSNKDGVIELEEYKAWVKSNPDAMNFVRELHTQSTKAVAKVRQSVYFKRVSKMGIGNMGGIKELQKR